MRKPRDYDAELKALDERARQLKDERIRSLGMLVIATGADAIDAETLAGALVAASTAEPKMREAWRANGAAFFSSKRRAARTDVPSERSSPAQVAGTAQSADSGTLPL